MSNLRISLSEELLHIYSTLRRLGHFRKNKASQDHGGGIEASVFPRRFLLKLLDERLEDLSEFAKEICEDLFKQIGGKAKQVDPRQLEQFDQGERATDLELGYIRYPEFDEFFHYSVQYLYDFLIDLRWHEADIEPLTKSDSDYVVSNLKHTNLFLQFRRSLVNIPATSERPTLTVKTRQQKSVIRSPKSNLVKSVKSHKGRSASPTLRRRVRFENASFNKTVDGADPKVLERRLLDQDLKEVHSSIALDLLIHAVDIFVQNLWARFLDWSSSTNTKLSDLEDQLFDSKERLRARQLQLVAKSTKVYIDVHLTLLDYLNEIKITYLIDKTLGTICARDSWRIMQSFKRPKIELYIERYTAIEANLLTGLVRQCLQLFMGLLVGEINFPPVELGISWAHRSREEVNRSHENIVNFINGWLKVGDILFGYARPKQAKRRAHELEKSINQVQRPKIATKSSTLSLGNMYTSSSRILAQMDNLSEFLSSFIRLSSDRLRHKQHQKYFLELVATGLLDFYKLISAELKQQLSSSKKTQSIAHPDANKQLDVDIDSMLAKIRSLKFIHIMTSAAKLLETEAIRAQLHLASLKELIEQLNGFTEICLSSNLTQF